MSMVIPSVQVGGEHSIHGEDNVDKLKLVGRTRKTKFIVQLRCKNGLPLRIGKRIWSVSAYYFRTSLRGLHKTLSKVTGTFNKLTNIDCWQFVPTEIKCVAAIALFAAKPKTDSEIVRWSAAVD